MSAHSRSLRKKLLRAVTVAAVVAVPLAPAVPALSTTTVSLTNARINARWSSVVDSAGNTWSARSGFVGPVNRSDGLAGRDIAGTTDDVLYQSNLWGMTGFNRAVPNGDYTVRLLMAEDYHGAAGRRVFNVLSEGSLALEKVDIFAATGARATAYNRTFTTKVRDGSLDLTFVALADKPLVSAIEITTTTTSVPAPKPGDSGTKVELLTTTTDVSGGGKAPSLLDDVYTMTAGAGDSRSEVFWGTATGGRFRLAKGATVTTQFQLRHQFSDPVTGAKPSPSTWHTLFQLHGPTLSNTWPAPPLTIAWQNGTYRVGGGSAVPTSTGGIVNQGSWYMPYAQAPENVWRTFKVTTYLDGPGRGWVSIWIDGEPYLQRWMPKAGTMFTDSGAYSHKEISIKSGLYTATQSPTWSRWVQQRDVSISVTTAGGTQTTAVLD